MRCILFGFEVVSGLPINLGKSKLFQVGDVPNIDSLAWILGCKIGFLPSSYLGLPLGAKFKSKAMWDPGIERITLRLDLWKAKHLSKVGRLTLLKATLASIPNYYLSLFTILGSVVVRIKSLFRKFL